MAVNTKESIVFQSDSAIVNEYYSDQPNYLIEYNEEVKSNYCILYFSSNNIYYPNDEKVFVDQIKKKNKFEWYRTRVDCGGKHIFLRDIKKQWYLSGVNGNLNDPEKLLEFLKVETKGYKVICVGSSAGGFAAVMFGQLLNAETIFSFNGQFEIFSVLKMSEESVNPLVFRNKDNSKLKPYYNVLNFVAKPSSIYYFHGRNSWDNEQSIFSEKIALNRISFKTGHHGIPFLKSNLPIVINLPLSKLQKLGGKTFSPLFFSISIAGISNTMSGLNEIFLHVLGKFLKPKKKNI